MSVSRETIAAIRFGYGLGPGDPPPGGPEGVLAQAEAGARAGLLFPSDPMPARIDRIKALARANRRDRDSEQTRQLKRALRRYVMQDGARRIFQRALSPHGFFERLAAFWADHFTVSARNLGHRVLVPAYEIDAIRPHIMGRFQDMLVAVVQNPAMLHYLDQPQSFGPNSRAGKRRGRGLNENLAREVLELHTLGVGGPYTQTDVREFAELLTGYATRRGYGAFAFFPNRAEPGAETVLGRSYGPGRPSEDHAEDALRDFAAHPVTAKHLARKLAVHFVADDPPEDLVAHLEAAYRRSEGALPPVYAALLEHPASWESFGAKIKQPFDLVVSTLRATGLKMGDLTQHGDKTGRGALLALRNMNQPLFGPPGPDGWPEEAEAWITPQGLAARLTFAGNAGQLLARRTDLDPRRFAETALADALRPETTFVVGGAPDRWEGFALTLASPEFNRR